jgi:hypothetical protein
MPEMTITSPYVHSRVDAETFTMGNPMPESTLTLCQNPLYLPVRDFGFGLRHLHDACTGCVLMEGKSGVGTGVTAYGNGTVPGQSWERGP